MAEEEIPVEFVDDYDTSAETRNRRASAKIKKSGHDIVGNPIGWWEKEEEEEEK